MLQLYPNFKKYYSLYYNTRIEIVDKNQMRNFLFLYEEAHLLSFLAIGGVQMKLQFLTKEQFDLLFNNSNDFIFFVKKVDVDYQFIYINKAFKNSFSKEMIGKKITEVLPQNNCTTFIKHLNLAMEEKTQVDFEDFYFVDSQLKKFKFSILPIVHEEGISLLVIAKEVVHTSSNVENQYSNLQRFFQDTNVATLYISREGKILEANQQFITEFKLDFEKVKGNCLTDTSIVNHMYVEQLKKAINKVIREEKTLIKFVSITGDKDDIQNYCTTLIPLWDRNEIFGIYIVFHKLPEYFIHQKEWEVTHGFAHFKRVIHSAAEISITNSEGVIIDVNDKFIERTGYSKEELIGNKHSILNSRYHTKEFFQNLWTTILRGEIWRGEICNRTKTGSFYWVDTTIIPILDHDGHIQQMVSVNFDITEKKRMLTELYNVERMFRMITENTNDLIVITNEDGIILYVSSAYERKLGYHTEELVGQFYTKVLSKESKEIWNNELLNIASSAHSKIELIHETKNGKPLWTECNYTVVKDYIRNRGTQIIMVAREITERKEFENKLLFLAYHDTLTQLPNRRYLQKEFPYIIKKAKSKKESIAVLYVDGDNFKAVNDHFGHDVGDEFINHFGEALFRSVRSSDLVVRIGGDEFIIILTGLERNEVKREEQVKQIIHRINDVLQAGWTIHDHLFTPTASIGIAFYPDHGNDLDTLLDCSDKALYDIKVTSKDNYKFYEEKPI